MHGQAIHMGSRSRAGEPRRPAAAQQTLKNGFRLIASVMGENDALQIVGPANRLKESESQCAKPGGTIGGKIVGKWLDLAQSAGISLEH